MATVLRDAHTNMPGWFSRPDRYDRLTRPFFARLHARVVADVAAADLPAGSRVLDVGTGPGRLPLAIAAALPSVKVDAVDLSPRMIAYGRQQAHQAGAADRVTFAVGDVAALPYPDDIFDLIVSSMSQHHWADPHAGMRDLRRVLHPGGRIWIYDMRMALGCAHRAAQAALPTATITCETIHTGRLPISLVGRITIS